MDEDDKSRQEGDEDMIGSIDNREENASSFEHGNHYNSATATHHLIISVHLYIKGYTRRQICTSPF